jgi:hypothetical protein
MLLGEQHNVLLHQLPVFRFECELNEPLQYTGAGGKISRLDEPGESLLVGRTYKHLVE